MKDDLNKLLSNSDIVHRAYEENFKEELYLKSIHSKFIHLFKICIFVFFK